MMTQLVGRPETAGSRIFCNSTARTFGTWRRARSHHTHRCPDRCSVGRFGSRRRFLPARWDRATKAEHDYLRAMAVDGDNGSSTGEVARRLGRHTRSRGQLGQPHR